MMKSCDCYSTWLVLILFKFLRVNVMLFGGDLVYLNVWNKTLDYDFHGIYLQPLRRSLHVALYN